MKIENGERKKSPVQVSLKADISTASNLIEAKISRMDTTIVNHIHFLKEPWNATCMKLQLWSDN